MHFTISSTQNQDPVAGPKDMHILMRSRGAMLCSFSLGPSVQYDVGGESGIVERLEIEQLREYGTQNAFEKSGAEDRVDRLCITNLMLLACLQSLNRKG